LRLAFDEMFRKEKEMRTKLLVIAAARSRTVVYRGTLLPSRIARLELLLKMIAQDQQRLTVAWRSLDVMKQQIEQEEKSYGLRAGDLVGADILQPAE
jgi:hypothetical protein